MYTIKIKNKDTNALVFSNSCVEDYTYNKGLLNELRMVTKYSSIYTTIRNNEILFITEGE